MNPMNIAVVGMGGMGQKHAAVIQQQSRASLIAVCDVNEGRLNPWVSENGFRGSVFADPLECLSDDRIDLASICVPTLDHQALAVHALPRMHVMVEKPMADTPQGCDAILKAAERSSRKLMVAHVTRFFPAYEYARSAVQDGRLGEVRVGSFFRRAAAPTCSPWMLSAGNNSLLDLLIHDLDFAIMLGTPVSVRAVGRTSPNRRLDVYRAELRMEGFDIAVEGGWFDGGGFPFHFGFMLAFERDTLCFDSRHHGLQVYHADGRTESIDLPRVDPYAEELNYFLDVISANGKPGRCPPEQSATAVRLVYLLLESVKKGGTEVPVP